MQRERPFLILIPVILLALLFLPSLISVHASAASVFVDNQSASLVVGEPDFVTSGAGCVASPTDSTMCDPYGLGFDSHGNLWVVDEGNNRVLEFTSTQSNGPSASLVIQTRNDMRDLGLDSSNNVYVSDYSYSGIDQYTSPTYTCAGCSSTPLVGGFGEPDGFAFDSHGNLWVASARSGDVVEYAAPLTLGETPTLTLGSFASSACATASSSGTATTGFCWPDGLAFDSSGNLWVSDAAGDNIREFVPGTSGCLSNTLCAGMSSSLTVGVGPCPNGQTGSPFEFATASSLCYPRGITFDSSGNLWVADTDNYRVLEFPAPLVAGESAAIVLGQPDFSTTNAVTTQTSVGQPEDLAFDSHGNLWVSDLFNSRVLEFTTTNPVTAPEFPVGTILSIATPVLAFGAFLALGRRNSKKLVPRANGQF